VIYVPKFYSLHPLLVDWLQAWRKETPYQANDDVVFPSFRLKGRKPTRANMLVADHLQPAARKAGITGQIGFHTLRRTLATVLVANGKDVRLVQELLRHSNPLITLDAYARSTTPAKIEAQGWVMRQLLPEDSKARLAAAKPASTRAM
jgi:integrase